MLEEKARVGKDKVTRAADRMKARLGELEQENEVVRGESQRVAALALKLEKRLAKVRSRWCWLARVLWDWVGGLRHSFGWNL